MNDAIIHSYEGRYIWEVGTTQTVRVIPSVYKLCKQNPYVTGAYVDFETWYTKEGVFVGGTRGGAIRINEDGTPFDWSQLVKKNVKVRVNPYSQTDPKGYDPLQPMRDNYAAYQGGTTESGFVGFEIVAIENLATDYYRQLEQNAVLLGAELKTATNVDTIGVLMSTFGASAGAIGAVVAGAGWLLQSLSGKKKLTKEFQATLEKGQKDLAEMSSIYNAYKSPINPLFIGAAALGLVALINKKNGR